MALVLCAGPAFAQMRLESPAPGVLSAPAVSLSRPVSAALIAPSLAVPALSFAPALSAVEAPAPAAAEGPVHPANAQLSAVGRAAAPNGDAPLPERSLNAFWDGLAIPAQDDAALFVPATAPGLLPEAAGSSSRAASAAPWLALKDKKYAAALDAAVRLARGTKAGRRAFDAAQKALGDGTLPLEVKDLGKNHGEYNYLKGRLSLSSKMFLPGREAELAGTLAHELLHVAQHAQGLPSNALELEIEAHLLDLELLAELGVKPPKDTFARQAYDALRQGPKQFAALIAMAVPGSPYLGDSSFAEIADQLDAELDSMEDRRGPKAALLVKVIEADLKRINSARGRRTYQAFSDRVLALLKARAAEARKDSSLPG
jgi:hypothetical protein